MNPGNTALVEYGIYQEDSDLRAHVCPLAKKVYVFPTSAGIDAIEEGDYRLVSVYTGSIITAEGYIVPPDDIMGCIAVEIKDNVWDWAGLHGGMSTTTKGKRAARLVSEMIKHGRFPAPLIGQEIADVKSQIGGTDFVISAADKKIQVKCDLRGGGTRGENNCTGNLFLQVRECNPGGAY